MAHWQDCAVTNAGIGMLNELMAGRRLTITGAYGCMGKSDPAALERLEDLTGDKRRLDLLDVVNGETGKTVKIQVNNANLEESFLLEQIGVLAQLDGEGEKLLFVMQDQRGVEIPTQAENPGFILEIYGDIEITNDVEFHVDLTGFGAIVTPVYLAEVMGLHDESTAAHPDIRVSLAGLRQSAETALAALPKTGNAPPGTDTAAASGQHYYDHEGQKEYVCLGQDAVGKYIWALAGATDAADLTYNSGSLKAALDGLGSAGADAAERLAALESRVALIELMFNTNVSGNPFSVTFDGLDGLQVAGVWNTAQKRVEF